MIKNKVYELAEVESGAIVMCERCALFDICSNPICITTYVKKRKY